MATRVELPSWIDVVTAKFSRATGGRPASSTHPVDESDWGDDAPGPSAAHGSSGSRRAEWRGRRGRGGVGEGSTRFNGSRLGGKSHGVV
jgi:hypothetical protein